MRIGITEHTSYTVESSNKTFPSYAAAENYLIEQEKKGEANFDRYVYSSYSGTKLVEEYGLDHYAIWQVLGEDPNCDLGGHHHQPDLGLVEGTLEQAIRHAVSLPSFYSWGGGGTLVKRDAPKVLKL